jgi:bacteriocin biosynthesis cyclodehydratase domain-containing protein
MAGAIRVTRAPPACLAVASTGQFGERVSTFLAATRPGCREFSPRRSELTDAFAGSSMVVLALWRPDQKLCESADELSFRHRVPWLPIIMEHPVIRVGPMVRPPAGPCFGCYARRRVQHDPDRWASAILGEAYSNDPSSGPEGYLPHHARMTAALALAMLARPAIHDEGQVAGDVTTIRLFAGAGGLRTWPVIACHGCDRCRPGTPSGRPDWLRELSARTRADGRRAVPESSHTGDQDHKMALR